jgi:hypothetical protein
MKETIIPSASLHGVDNWFQILRRKVNMLERPVTSATNKRRWNAYAGYNPEWMTKLIEIQRVYNNYCMTNKRKLRESGDYRTQPTTPAMRVGISTSEYTLDDILSFSPHDLLI